MKQYLKMADVFPVEIRTDDESGSLICDEDGVIIESFSGDKVADYTLHAINSHDELVAEVWRLTASLNHANSNHELFERQYYLEKDRCEELQTEVERLRQALIDAATSLETIHVRSYGEDSFLDSKHEMRSYAGSRAKVARAALAEQ